MAELQKQWNDGELLTVAYDGDRDGSAAFTSDENESIDREMSVSFVDKSRSVIVERTVKQIGLREVFNVAEGPFMMAEGTFNVLKTNEMGGGMSYTPLTYIEATGEQAISLDYIVKETDVIEMEYTITSTSRADKFLFQTANTWVSQYLGSAYVRFGHSSSATTTYVRNGQTLKLQKGALYVNGTKRLTLSYTGMGTQPLTLFAGMRSNDGGFYSYGYCQCRAFRITDGDGVVVMSLKPKMRSDGAVGLLDEVSGRFYRNEGSGNDFIYA